MEAVTELERAILNVITYRDALQNSPRLELDATINALNGASPHPRRVVMPSPTHRLCPRVATSIRSVLRAHLRSVRGVRAYSSLRLR